MYKYIHDKFLKKYHFFTKYSKIIYSCYFSILSMISFPIEIQQKNSSKILFFVIKEAFNKSYIRFLVTAVTTL